MKSFSPQAAMKERRQLGLRVRLDRRISDLAKHDTQLLLQVLFRHGVVCVVDQPLLPRELHDVASRWGEVIQLPPGLALANQEPGLPSITRAGNIRPDDSIIPSARFAEYWHHDGDFWPPGQNFIVSFLSGVRMPAVGGHTGFLDSRLAFESLEAAQREELSNASVWVRPSEISDFAKAAPHELPPDVRHPVLVPHPVTGRTALYLPHSSTGVQTKDGRFWGTVESLVDSSREKLGILEHVWAEGDLVIMDNLQVMHRSMGGYGDQPRLLYRCQVRIQDVGA